MCKYLFFDYNSCHFKSNFFWIMFVNLKLTTYWCKENTPMAIILLCEYNLDKLLISTVTQGSNPMKHDTAWTLPQSKQTSNIYCHPGFKPHAIYKRSNIGFHTMSCRFFVLFDFLALEDLFSLLSNILSLCIHDEDCSGSTSTQEHYS
jgi:hypothetical protein